MKLFSRKFGDWVLDLSGIITQGTIVPYVGSAIFAVWLRDWFPTHSQVFALHPFLAFLLPFTLIDYLYYWNHRLLHTKPFWFIHSVHHSSKRVDVIMTSRNVIWAPFFLVYIYATAIFVFVLIDPKYFIAGTFLSAAMDVWRHSGMKTPLDKYLGSFLILPNDHAWHHSLELQGKNFGANLNLWDRMHSTFHRSDEPAKNFGNNYEESFWRQLLLPKGGA